MIATTKTSKTTEGEYRVRLFIDGIYQAGADYFASDKAEANATAAFMIERACHSDETTDFAKAEAADYVEECGEENETQDETPALVWYDVCNDYSLEERGEPTDLASMEKTQTAAVALYHGSLFWSEHGELVYFLGQAGLTCKEI
jgi:hypothetical protein